MNSDFRKSARQNAFVGALAVGATAMFAAETGMAAAVVQPDLQVGASYVDNGGFTGEDDVSSAGAEVRAKLDIGWVNERGSVTLVPMVRATRYSDDALSEREEQRLTFNWLRNFQTGASNTQFDFSRQDLFSSELRDITLDPDEVPIDDTTDTGIVDQDTTRTRFQFRQDFAKGIGLRDEVLFAAQYRDISYDETGATTRVDFTDALLGAGWRRALSERTDVVLMAGVERYDGDNGVTVDSVGAELGFDFAVSETAALFVQAGYQNSESETETQDLGSDSQFIFSIGAEKSTEVTRYAIDLGRNVRPTGQGGVTTETGLSLFMDRQLSERMRFGAGVAAFQQERNVTLSPGNDRDYVTGKLQLSYQLSRQWSIEAQVRHVQQDFESSSGSLSEDRNRASLTLRWRGLNEVRVPRGRRFLRTGY